MPLVDTNVPNLINGVSQQANNLRYPSQCDEQLNFLSSLTEGLIKRPPSSHIAALMPRQDRLFVSDITRDQERQFTMFVSGGLTPSLRIFNRQGVEVPVKGASGAALTQADMAYLASLTPETSLKVLTVEDTTFVLNRDKVTAQLPDITPARTPEGLVMVKTVHSKSVYGISLYNNLTDTEASFLVSHTTGENTTEDQAAIASALVLAAQNITYTNETTYQEIGKGVRIPVTVQVGNGNHNTGGDASQVYDFSQDSGLLHIRKKDGSNFRLEVHTTSSESLYAYKDSTQNFATLPKRGWADFALKIIGDPDTEGDEYYLKYVPTMLGGSGFTTGFWKEANATGLKDKLDTATMPHILENHGSYFVFKEASWDSRTCGDEDSNPAPSFVGKPIRSIFFTRNRLGFCSDQNAILSESGKFFNFWRTTVIQVLDSDTIDTNAPESANSVLNHTVESSEKFFLFSESTQFILNSGDLLTPKSANISRTTDFENSERVAPVAIGNRVFYAFKRGAFSGVSEYSLRSDTGLFDAEDVTDHVPRYIDGSVTLLFGSDTEKSIFALSDGYTTGLYVYRFYYHQQDRLLSSWSKWDFGGKIVYAFLANSELYLVIERAGTLFLETVDLQPGRVDDGGKFTSALDRKIPESAVTKSYDAVLNRTTFTLPYVPNATKAVIVTRPGALSTPEGTIVPPVSIAGNQIVVVGDYREIPLWFGENYTALCQLSQPRLREGKGSNTVIVPGRFQIRNGYLAFHDTLYFRTEVQLTGGRPSSVKPYTPRSVGGLVLLGAAVDPQEGVHRFSVFSKSDQVKVRIINDTPLPCALTSVDWEALYSYRAQRV